MILQLHHFCIQTNCYADSLHFYQNVLGFSLEKETVNFHHRAYNSWLKKGKIYLELQTSKKETILTEYHKQTTGLAHFCFLTDDIKKIEQKLQLHHVTFLPKNGGNIYYVEGEPLLKVVAPEGTIIEFRTTALIR